MVTLYVEDGKDESQTFTVHEHLLCNASPIFKSALQEASAEESETSLCLHDADYDTLKHFVPWLYSGRLSREAGELEYNALYWVAAQLNTVAITYELSGLTEEAVTLVNSYMDNPRTSDRSYLLPSADQVAEIYRKSTATNAMRKLVVDLFGTKPQPSWHAEGNVRNEYIKKCPEFIADLFVELGKKTMNSEKELRSQIAVLTTKNANLKSSRDQYVQESRQSDRRVEELEEYLSQNCDVDPRDI